MNILVTGGLGFIGSNFVRYWRNKFPRDRITILDLVTYAGHPESIKDLPRIRLIKGDICDVGTVSVALKNQEVVVHFAAESHVDRSIVGPGEFVRTNLTGTQVLLQESTRARIKLFHHISTDEVFGDLPIDRPDIKFNEDTPYRPHSPYSASKAGSDHLVRAWHHTYGLPVTITNTSNNYGPFHDPEKLIPRFITNLIEGRKVPLMGQGENIRDWIHVTDHCRAVDVIIHAALDDPEIVGQSFCVGGNSEKTNLEVTRALLEMFGRDMTAIEHIPHRLGHDTRYAVDSSKIKRMLNWEPRISFAAGLKDTVDWYRRNEWWWKPLKEGRPIVDPQAQEKYQA